MCYDFSVNIEGLKKTAAEKVIPKVNTAKEARDLLA
jgi:hypothetical protein